jgi:hypothetical protein
MEKKQKKISQADRGKETCRGEGHEWSREVLPQVNQCQKHQKLQGMNSPLEL